LTETDEAAEPLIRAAMSMFILHHLPTRALTIDSKVNEHVPSTSAVLNSHSGKVIRQRRCMRIVGGGEHA